MTLVYTHQSYTRFERAFGKTQAQLRAWAKAAEIRDAAKRNGLTAEEDKRLDEILNRHRPVTEEFK